MVNGKEIRSNEKIEKHAEWVEKFLPKYDKITEENVMDILKEEVGITFTHVLKTPAYINVHRKAEKRSYVLSAHYRRCGGMDVKKDTSSTIKRAQRFQVILIGEGILVGGIGGLLVLLYRLCLEGHPKG